MPILIEIKLISKRSAFVLYIFVRPCLYKYVVAFPSNSLLKEKFVIQFVSFEFNIDEFRSVPEQSNIFVVISIPFRTFTQRSNKTCSFRRIHSVLLNIHKHSSVRTTHFSRSRRVYFYFLSFPFRAKSFIFIKRYCS